MRSYAILAVIALLATVTSLGQSRPPSARSFAIVPPERPRCLEQQACVIDLRTSDGREPLQWRILRGSLPAGLTSNRNTGRISGTPTAAGVSTAVVIVTDANYRSAQLRITISVISILEVRWETAPALNGNSLAGSLTVLNHSGNNVGLTVVVVAVNEINKAFTLGYRHFDIAPGATSPPIPFGMQMQLPPGRYGVRVDAVGEVAAKNIIYRSALEAGPFATP